MRYMRYKLNQSGLIKYIGYIRKESPISFIFSTNHIMVRKRKKTLNFFKILHIKTYINGLRSARKSKITIG